MSYDGKVMRRALQRFEADRQEREQRFQERQESLFRRQPRLREIDRQLRSTVSRVISSALRQGKDPQEAVASLRRENLSLQEERRELLRQLRLPEDCLEQRPACLLCGDTGYRNGRVCRCLRGYYVREQQRELSRMLDLGEQSFDRFSLDWYSDAYHADLGISARENMDWVFRTCKKYAEEFGPGSGSLLLTGKPGLGKTFLSAAIAREVSGEGWSVVYDTAISVFHRMEERKFGREEDDGEEDRILRCDLLILDDLGTEMTTPFVQSALYQIINQRLLEHRSVVLSTNLDLKEIERRYSSQIASRMEGEYQVLPFFGEDIRKLKRERRRPDADF